MLNNLSRSLFRMFLVAAAGLLILRNVGFNHVDRGGLGLLPKLLKLLIYQGRLKPRDYGRPSTMKSARSDMTAVPEARRPGGQERDPTRNMNGGTVGHSRFERRRDFGFEPNIKLTRPTLLAAGSSLLLVAWLPNQPHQQPHARNAKFADQSTVRLSFRRAVMPSRVWYLRSGRRKGRFQPALITLGSLTIGLCARLPRYLARQRDRGGRHRVMSHNALMSPRQSAETMLAILLLPWASVEKGDQSLVLHPYLLALFPALSLVSDNVELLSIDKAVLTIAMVTLIVTHLCLRLLILAGQDSQKAGLLVSSALLLFFSYGHVYQFVTKTLGGPGIRHRHALLAWAALTIAAVRYSLGEHAGSPAQTYFLNSVSSCLLALSLLQIARHQLAPPGRWRPPRQLVSKPPGTRPVAAYPDVYYLILDSHASPITISEVYDYDIGAFLQRLKNKGFYIAEKSCSNYAMTMLSLASSLNLDYVDAWTGEIGLAGKGLGLSKQLIENNTAMRFLMAMGYKTIFMGSGFSITQSNRYAHVNIDCGSVDETVGHLVQSTLLRAFADRAQFIANDKRSRIRCLFSQLGKVHKLQGPKFVFAHIPSPQWPFLFDANGNPTNGRGLNVEQKKEAYLNQLTFIDGEVEKLTDEILTGATVDPIIILQSDHGPNFAFSDGYHSPNPPREVLREKMQIFNAIYLPDGGGDFLYPSISPVNIFRVIFSEYFGAKMPLLDDRSYFSTYEFPYRLLDVTNFVQD